MLKSIAMCCVVGVLSAAAVAPALAQGLFGGPRTPATREQVRTRLLDACVVDLGRELGPKVSVTGKCNCYSAGVLKLLTAEEIAAFPTDGTEIPSRIRGEATEVYARCKR